MKHIALYIPGLGDHYDNGRSLALKGWQLWGVKARLLPIKWYNDGTYDAKLTLVRESVRAARQQGYKVSLIGESAGASLALNAAAELPEIHRIVLVAGVNSSKLPISPRYNTRAPAFVESAGRVSRSLEAIDRSKIHTVRALWDPVVSPHFNDIQGAHEHVIFSSGHFTTIVLCLSVLSGFIAHIIKQK